MAGKLAIPVFADASLEPELEPEPEPEEESTCWPRSQRCTRRWCCYGDGILQAEECPELKLGEVGRGNNGWKGRKVHSGIDATTRAPTGLGEE